MAGILRGLFGKKSDPSTPASSPTGSPATDRGAASDAPAPAPGASAASPASTGTPAAGLRQFFTEDHRACDDAWARLEELLEGDDDVQEAWDEYERVMLRHLAWEEEVLFPAFEEATGMTGGPTMVMRMEHDQMRAVIQEMADLLAQGDRKGVLARGDTMLMLVQQHNMKEEGMLYPMAEQALGGRWSELSQRLK
ncbi:MAG: hemerythrin domain-containing protein [Deltaproteobacteria bacterium]|nr:MAG: hemerythrin domain-containing protein [Deltaproteobacteria bacterium]